ncbi:hypothetical protein HZB03_02715, partial [Candidatus Woesearchaeota archaeon]|nr:hypothetical protein [Candidatus Woesearchaeota archaeon]
MRFSNTAPSHWESIKELTLLLRNHLLAFILALFILTFLFSSLIPFIGSLIFVTVLLYVVHELHFNKHLYETYEVFGIFAVFLLTLLFLFILLYDLLTLTLLVVYILSLLISAYLYVHHERKEHFAKIMIAQFYSHVLAAAAAAAITTGLAWLALPTDFVNFWYIIAFIALPAIFFYFFATLFFYLYFFDRKHIVIDLRRGAKHAVVYSSVALAILIAGFVVTSSLLFSSQKNTILDVIDATNTDIGDAIATRAKELETQTGFSQTEFWDLSVVRGLLDFLSAQQTALDGLRTQTLTTRFSILNLLKDETHTTLTPIRVKLDANIVYAQSALDTINEARASYDSLNKMYGTLNNTAFTLQIDGYVSAQKKILGERFIERSPSSTILFLEGKLTLRDPSFGKQFGDGALLNYAYAHGLDYLSPEVWPSHNSIFVRNIAALVQHTTLFQHAVLLASSANIAREHDDEYSPLLDLLISGRTTLETPLSEAVR